MTSHAASVPQPSSHLTVGLVRRGYSPSGGAERYLKRFAEALARAGHDPLLFASPEWPKAEWPHGQVIPVEGDTPIAFADTLRTLTPDFPCDFLFSLERVHACDCYRAGDGVHKLWLERRTTYEPKWRSATRFLNRKHAQILALEEEMFSKQTARSIIVNSKMVLQEIVNHYQYPADRIEVVYNGIPSRSFERRPGIRQKIREELWIKPDECLVLFVGSGWDRKGLQFAIRAVDNLPASTKARLVVAGKGNRLKTRSSKTIFLGPVTDVLSYLEAADCFILPTTYDPFSNACLEALAAGLPVITTSMNGFSEIIKHQEQGWILNAPDDIQDIQNAITFWSDIQKNQQLKPSLIEYAKNFTAETNLHQTLEAITRLLKLQS